MVKLDDKDVGHFDDISSTSIDKGKVSPTSTNSADLEDQVNLSSTNGSPTQTPEPESETQTGQTAFDTSEPEKESHQDQVEDKLLGISLLKSNPYSTMFMENQPRECEIPPDSGCLKIKTQKRELVQVLKQKQSERVGEFAQLSAQYKQDEEIASLGFTDLIDALQKREFTATQVLETYIAKALDVNSRTNAITDFNPKAFAIAKELDSRSDISAYPLFGIPVCIKDDTNVQFMDTTHGYAKRLYKPAKESAVIVRILMDLGCVPFCKTNVPQTLFTYGSDNPVFGTTVSCQNPELSPGGSSSGTGALVGGLGCMFGTGTDIGGSLRIPAAFNNCSSIKCTIGRLSDLGIESSLPNLVGMTAVPGIIGQTPTIVATVFKHMVENYRQCKYDPQIPPIVWNTKLYESKSKLRIGYFTNMPFFPVMGDTEEVVLKAKQKLESLGHTLVPFTPPDAYSFMRTVGKFILADHCKHFKKCWKGEEIAKGAFLMWIGSKLPRWLQRFVGRLMRTKAIPLIYSSRTGAMFGTGAEKSTDLWDATGEKKLIIGQVLAEWKKLNIDGLICPLFPFPAPPVNFPGLLPVAVCYSMLWNLVDFPAAVLPFGKESGKNFTCYDPEGDQALKLACKGIKKSVGASINVQIVGLPYQEEIVLRLLTELEPYSKNESK